MLRYVHVRIGRVLCGRWRYKKFLEKITVIRAGTGELINSAPLWSKNRKHEIGGCLGRELVLKLNLWDLGNFEKFLKNIYLYILINISRIFHIARLYHFVVETINK